MPPGLQRTDHQTILILRGAAPAARLEGPPFTFSEAHLREEDTPKPKPRAVKQGLLSGLTWFALTCYHLVTYPLPMDDVFKALADPTRRSLLDELFKKTGRR